jgi:tetratricopeptide (TPR) repeat protein
VKAFGCSKRYEEVGKQLSRDPQNHLSAEELAFLVEAAESADPRGPDSDWGLAEAHVSGCGMCGTRVRAARSAQARLRSMASTVASERTRDCPAEDKWAALSAGLCADADAAPLLAHASTCDYCGPLLRKAAEDFAPELSAQEQTRIGQLPSALPGWQRDVALKMAGMSGATEIAGVSSVRKTRPHLTWPFSAWTGWAVPVAAAAVIAVAAALWLQRSPSLSSTNQLIAQAYTAQRPTELRFPGAGYSPVRQERGDRGPHHSRMDDPPELLEAETHIARGLARYPRDPGWLQAGARADMYEGHYEAAIEALHQAKSIRPDDRSLTLDLATAYFERAGTKRDPAEQASDYNLALQALSEVLSKNPNDLVALFNRATTYERLKKKADARADWQQYLQLDPSGEWSLDAHSGLEKTR